ncbi:MAG: fibronectin type III domain-containing protein [Isosphaeraceae bacterium]
MPTPTYADAFRQGRDEWIPPVSGTTVPRDSDGWPLSDAKNVVWEGQEAASMAGTYLLQFRGKAAVEVQLTGSFSVGTTAYGKDAPLWRRLRRGYQHDHGAALMPAADIMSLTFRNSQRTDSSPTNTGFSDVRVMRPTTMGGSTPYSTDSLFASAIRDALGRFTTIRYGTSMLDSGEVNWSDRTRPSYFSARRGFASMAWEDLVLLSNEIGKDMYLMIPMGATDDYITRLAKLIRFGSDGTNPYDSPQAAPVYPPLNPNLKVYLEWSNETWNWAFPQAYQGYQLTADAISRNTREGQIINYDHSGRGDLWKRWTALRTVDASTIFRSVWGDAAMGDRVRVLIEYQMNNGQDTAVDELGFIDAYFNNGDGQQHVANPHPVSYYIWGSGGATYYDAANARGYQTRIVPGDEGIESLGLAAGTVSAAPTGTPWTFSGNAGIAANPALASLTRGATLGTLTQTLSQPTAMGYAFTVGSSNVAVYQLGRWVASGNSRTHVLHLIRESDKAELGKVTVDTRTGTAGSFVYGTFPYPVELAANTTYYLLSEETNAQDAFYGQDTTITPNSSGAITVSKAMSATYNSQSTTSAWTYTSGTSGARSFGPVDLKFATRGPGDLGFIPLTPEGDEMAYVRKDGSISQVINFTATGTYAVDFYAAAISGLESAIDIYFDDQRVTPKNWGYPDYRSGSEPFLPGRNWGRDYRKFDLYTSVPFQVATTGNHTIRIIGRGGIAGETDPRLTLLLDRIRIASVDAFFEGGIPSPWFPGPASYQAQLHDNSRYAQAYGLSVVAYEGSWGVGGDSFSSPLQNYAKYVDPRAKRANLDAYDAFTRSGGDLLTWGSYQQWENTYHSATYPLVQAIDERNQSLPVPNQNGVALPGTLDGTNTAVRSHLSNTNAFWTTGLTTWNVFVPKAGLYQFTRTGGNSGGTMALAVDGGTNLAIGPGETTLSGSTFLTAGFHAVMLKCVAGGGWLGHIDVTQLATVPDRPTDLTATAASSSQINVGWVDRSTNETGFKVYRATDAAFTRGLTLVATTGPNATSWQDTGLLAGTTYFYRVSAANSAGVSPYAEFVSARTNGGSSSGAVDFSG